MRDIKKVKKQWNNSKKSGITILGAKPPLKRIPEVKYLHYRN